MIKEKAVRTEVKDEEGELHGYESKFGRDRAVTVVCYDTYFELHFVKGAGSAVVTTTVRISRDIGDELAVLIRRLNGSMDEIVKADSEYKTALASQYAEIIRWMLGENGDFPSRAKGKGQFWWREELRKRFDSPFSLTTPKEGG